MPKTYNNLYPQVYAFENLYQTHRQARRGGKRQRPEVAEFEHDLGENLLRLQEEKAQVFPVKNGITFLGWRLFPHHRRLQRENVRHAIRRLQWQQAAFARGELSQEKLTASVQAWLAHAAHGNTYQLCRRIMRRFVFAPERENHAQST